MGANTRSERPLALKPRRICAPVPTLRALHPDHKTPGRGCLLLLKRGLKIVLPWAPSTHPRGHLPYLEKARSFRRRANRGRPDSDENVRGRKGPDRPIVHETSAKRLTMCRHVDMLPRLTHAQASKWEHQDLARMFPLPQKVTPTTAKQLGAPQRILRKVVVPSTTHNLHHAKLRRLTVPGREAESGGRRSGRKAFDTISEEA